MAQATAQSKGQSPCPFLELHGLADIQFVVQFPEKSYTGQCIRGVFFFFLMRDNFYEHY